MKGKIISISFLTFLLGAMSYHLLVIKFQRPPVVNTKDTSFNNADYELRDSFILIGDLIHELEGNEYVKVEAPYVFDIEKYHNNSDSEFPISSILVYNSNLNLIARMDNKRPFALPILDGSGVLKLNDNKEAFKLMDVTGLHHSETSVLEVVKSGEKYNILPICTNQRGKCSFYNTVGYLITEDLDNDGILEIAEIHDEYPPEGGRGNPVLAGVYKYNSDTDLFDLVNDTDYELYYGIIKRGIKSLIKTNQMRGKLYKSFEDYWHSFE